MFFDSSILVISLLDNPDKLGRVLVVETYSHEETRNIIIINVKVIIKFFNFNSILSPVYILSFFTFFCKNITRVYRKYLIYKVFC